ncbi:hypothetical protein ACFO5K_25875 [Nocardia halotolerans]|uniref:Outer membrane channel protein CpnT-like N-terminal domain-containing protein n=1 Tax=Nocardia halotolerans TaxID=1755878 RepID=A0ABV8VRR4_9NOCA
MGIELPGVLRWVADMALGQDWPEGDETAMRRLGDSWTTTSTNLDDITEAAAKIVHDALTSIEGDTHVALEEFWRQIEDAFVQVSALATQLGETLDADALNIEYTKLSIIAALIILAAEVSAALIASCVTFGAATPGIVLAQVATKAAIKMLLRQLLAKILQGAIVGAAEGVLKGYLTDLAVQSIQINRGDRTTMDLGLTQTAVTTGGVEGLFAGAIGGSVTGSVGKGDGLAGALNPGSTVSRAAGVAGIVNDVVLGLEGRRLGNEVNDATKMNEAFLPDDTKDAPANGAKTSSLDLP